MTATDPRELDRMRNIIVFSADAHIGPQMDEMRQYCPSKYLADFDEQARAHKGLVEALMQQTFFGIDSDAPEAQRLAAARERNHRTDADYRIGSLLKAMDNDGVAAEIFFHGSSVNGGPMPLVGMNGFSFDHRAPGPSGTSLEQRGAGLHIYNQWCADAVKEAPQRLFPAVPLPLWDIRSATDELTWCVENGLRFISLQAPRPGIRGYDDPAWEPLWSLAEDAGVVFATHGGALDAEALIDTSGPHWDAMLALESGGWAARRAIPRFIFGGVFARHPGLRYIVSEQNGDWWSQTIREYDSVYWSRRWQLVDTVPEPPSFYLAQNVFIGGSFLANFEAQWSVEQNYWHNLMWGRDFPHAEGTWSFQEELAAGDAERNATHLAMRNTFSGVPAEVVVAILGGNAVNELGLDEVALREVANTINAPTLEELSRPIEAIPHDGGVLAFRTLGAWW